MMHLRVLARLEAGRIVEVCRHLRRPWPRTRAYITWPKCKKKEKSKNCLISAFQAEC